MDKLLTYLTNVLAIFDEMEQDGKMNDELYRKREIYQEFLKIVDSLY